MQASNPKGWQMVAGGRSGAETPGNASKRLPAPRRGARVVRPLRGRLEILDRGPGVSLRSTPGYLLASLRPAKTKPSLEATAEDAVSLPTSIWLFTPSVGGASVFRWTT